MAEPTTMDAAPLHGPITPCVVAIEGLRASEELEPGLPLSIGRSSTSGIQVDDAAVSRLHATITWDGTTVVLEDHGSRNGTIVGGKRVEGRVEIRGGDVITIGPARFVVVIPPRAAASSRPTRAITHAHALADRAAQCDLSVLILGETGVGKEVLARRIHASSRRKEGPFVAENCGSIPETLAESILFGHEKGAFTGASATKAGVFEAAHGGTLFLDEVGELPAAHQARMLRVLEERVVQRVGATRVLPVDVRVITATHRDLDREVARGHFRRDLLYRLDVLRIRVPPLRDRLEELPELVPALLSELAPSAPATVDEEVLALLRAQPFPGNVRELRNVLARALALSESGRLDAAAVAAALPEGSASRSASELKGQVASAERDAIERALAATGGNQTHAARQLGISRRALLYKMQRYGIGRARDRRSP
jgi:transcriptional regulator with PAS, ATPase and Fis domain